jgi:hypothetical protein
VHLQQVQAVVDGLDQSRPPRQQVNCPDAAARNAANPLRDFIVDVAGGHHRAVLRRPVNFPKTMGDS